MSHRIAGCMPYKWARIVSGCTQALLHSISYFILSRVLRDSTPRFVGPLVRPSVRPSVTLYFFRVLGSLALLLLPK